MFDILLIREIIAVIGTGISSYTDIKKGLIYDWTTYPMIAIGALLNIYESQLTAFLLAAIVFAAGYFLYYTGKIGGGDVKLYTALAMLLPQINGELAILNILIFSGLTALVFVSVYYTLKYFKKTTLKEALKENKGGVQKATLFGIIIMFYFYFLVANNFVSLKYALVFGTPMIMALVFVAFEKGIREKIFLEKITLDKLEEDELIAIEFVDKQIIEKLQLGFKGVLDQNSINKLKELGVKEVPVYRNLPKFAPFIFIGLIASILAPSFFSFLG